MTWFQMVDDQSLPQGVCRVCAQEAISAGHFTTLCKNSARDWNLTTIALYNIEEPTPEDKFFYIFFNDNEINTVRDHREGIASITDVAKRLNAVFSTETLLHQKKHRKFHKGKPCKCPDCGKSFQQPYYLNLHLKNTSKRACTECSKLFDKQNLIEHLESQHGRALYDCKICNKLFEDHSSMTQHMTESHNNIEHLCSVCGKCFVNERALRAHTFSHTLFHCQNCNRSFENRKCYVYHQTKCKIEQENEKVALVNDIYTCDYCKHQYTKKPSLRIHIIQKHLNVLPHQCQTCGKRTSTLAHLRSHETVHAEQRKVFQCFCGAKMTTELGYQLHQRIHTGERPYECQDCGERFLSSSRRLDHIKRRHRSTKDMPHGCDKCPARFVRPFELKKHYQAIHYSKIKVVPLKRSLKAHV